MKLALSDTSLGETDNLENTNPAALCYLLLNQAQFRRSFAHVPSDKCVQLNEQKGHVALAC